MKIIFSGGGTLGPVVPLLAIREAVAAKYPDARFAWVGTNFGPEREIVTAAGIPFYTIGAGKWRRYASFKNIIDIVKIIIAFFQSIYIIWREKPSCLISAGGFVSVPLHWAGWLLGVPEWVHQQDVEVGFANKLMFSFAKKVTTALEETSKKLPEYKSEWLGNPCRNLVATPDAVAHARATFKIPEGAPLIFALGGGTGSESLNRMVLDALQHWPPEWHVIHLLGRERTHELSERAAGLFPNYHPFPFFTTQMAAAYALATVVFARAGFNTLTELSALGKAAIIYPMYGTHQEANAALCAKNNAIVLMLNQTDSGYKLAQMVKDLVVSPVKREHLANHLHRLLPIAKPDRLVHIVEELVED